MVLYLLHYYFESSLKLWHLFLVMRMQELHSLLNFVWIMYLYNFYYDKGQSRHLLEELWVHEQLNFEQECYEQLIIRDLSWRTIPLILYTFLFNNIITMWLCEWNYGLCLWTRKQWITHWTVKELQNVNTKLVWCSSSFLSFHQESNVLQIVRHQCLAQPMAIPWAVVRSLVEQAVSIVGQTSRWCMLCLIPQSQVSVSFE